MKCLNEEFERAKRYDMPLSCCIFDIDDFKLINDTYGHIFGDQVLKQIGNLVKAIVRGTDIVARYGGEEFVILFTHTRLEDAVIAVEHIRRTISALTFLHNEKEVRVTATFGISSYLPENTNSTTLLHRADMGLYEGKKQYHKNCIVIYTENGYRIIKKEESLISNFEDIEETIDSFPPIEEGSIRGITHQKKFKENLLAVRTKLQCIRVPTQILIKAKDFEASFHHIGKRESVSLVGLGIILFLLIPLVFVDEKKGEEGIFSISSMLSPVLSSTHPRSNLSCTVSVYDDRSLDETFEETSPFGKYIEIAGAKEEGQLSEAFVKEKKVFSRRGMYTKGKLKTRIKREFVKEDLRRAFLLADL
jgi:diguanylate cyclase (GGDEF)-like protein